MKPIKLNKEQSKKIIEELTNPPKLTDEKRTFLEECLRVYKERENNENKTST